MVKRMIRGALERALAAAGPHRWAGLRGPRLAVLTYHRVLPPDHPERHLEQPGMIVEPATLAMHLETLAEFFEPVHLEEWLDAARRAEPLPRRACAITFDDGWRDNFEHAWPILQRHQMPATIFLVADLVGSGYAFWPNRLSRRLRAWEPGSRGELGADLAARLESAGIPLDRPGRALTAEDLDAVIERVKGRPDGELQRLMDAWQAAAGRETDPAPDLLDWEQVREMAATGLVRFGSHSRRHTRLLPGLEPAVLEDEIGGSRRLLERRLGRPVGLFCYPNGDYTAAALDLVRAGYDGAVTTDTGWARPGTDPHLVPRLGVHDDVSRSREAFLARLSGWF